jgi:2,5-diketo-D-gluconate reductase A
MKEVRLNNGVMMPSVGFGVYQIPKSETKQAVLQALEVGYRMIDTAASYFNEREVGEAIRESGLPRESVFVTSKLWVQDYEYDDALRGFDRSLSELGLDYIDLYLLHKPYGNYYAAWRALERLHKEGRIRAIGVTSFSNERLQDLFLHNEIKPAVNQIETHPFQQQQDANAFLKAEGIVHEAWAPFAEGQKGVFVNPVLNDIAAAHGKSVAAVILRWLNQRGVVVIPKSVRVDRIRENFNIFDFRLTDAEMTAISALDEKKSPIYDDMDLATVRAIGTYKIHE